jgi:hypothetical protein
MLYCRFLWYEARRLAVDEIAARVKLPPNCRVLNAEEFLASLQSSANVKVVGKKIVAIITCSKTNDALHGEGAKK